MFVVLIILLIVFGVLALIGLADCYIAYRFLRKPAIDSTAGFTWYWTAKWAFVTQTKEMVQKLPYLGKDLTEALGIRDDDGRVT